MVYRTDICVIREYKNIIDRINILDIRFLRFIFKQLTGVIRGVEDENGARVDSRGASLIQINVAILD